MELGEDLLLSLIGSALAGAPVQTYEPVTSTNRDDGIVTALGVLPRHFVTAVCTSQHVFLGEIVARKTSRVYPEYPRLVTDITFKVLVDGRGGMKDFTTIRSENAYTDLVSYSASDEPIKHAVVGHRWLVATSQYTLQPPEGRMGFKQGDWYITGAMYLTEESEVPTADYQAGLLTFCNAFGAP